MVHSIPAKNGCPPLNNIDCITNKVHKNPYSQLHSLLYCFSEYYDCFIRITDCSIRVSQFFEFTIRKPQWGLLPPLLPGLLCLCNTLHMSGNFPDSLKTLFRALLLRKLNTSCLIKISKCCLLTVLLCTYFPLLGNETQNSSICKLSFSVYLYLCSQLQ